MVGSFYKKNWQVLYVCVCVCVCRSLKLAGWTHWYLAGCIYKYACGFYIRYLAGLMEYICMWIFKVGKFEYIDIWQVLSQKKKKKIGRLLKIYMTVENICIWIYMCWKYDCWQDVDLYILKIWPLAGCKSFIENVTIGIVIEFEKKKNILERNNKEILKNNILIKW